MTIQPSAEIQTAVRELVAQAGVRRAAKSLTVSDTTIARLAGGLPVNGGTVALARERLAALSAESSTQSTK